MNEFGNISKFFFWRKYRWLSIGILLIFSDLDKDYPDPNYKEFFLYKHNKNARISHVF